MNIDKVVSIADLRKSAKKRLPRFAFDFIEGGVEGERCLLRNEEIFADYRLLPRYLVNVSARSQRASLFDKTYDSPFGIAPTGVAGLWRPEADSMLARAAAEANIPFILSNSSNASIEAIVKLAPRNTWFQLYATRDRAIGERQIGRVRDLEVETLVATIDVPITANRERNIRNGFSWPLRLRPSTVLDSLVHPRWLAAYLRSGAGMPLMRNWAPYAREGATSREVVDFFTGQTPTADQTWDDLERYRSLWPGRFVVKGILHPEDAVRATSVGADGIIVSNHGGRQSDITPSPIEVLPAIRAAVGPNQTLMLDSGIRRGSDILIALCLGAQFVFVGRATLYGVAAFGLPGARKAIDILRHEIDRNMAQLGSTDLAAFGKDILMGPHPITQAAVPAPLRSHRPGVLAPEGT